MHLNWRMPLGGCLSGVLPNPSLVTDEASLVIARSVFSSRGASAVLSLSFEAASLLAVQGFLPPQIRPKDLRAGTNITLTEMAGTIQIDAAGGSSTPDDADLQNAVRTFQPPALRLPDFTAGANIVLTPTGTTTVISASAGSTPDDAALVEAHRAFLPKPVRLPPVEDAQALAAQRAFLPRPSLPAPPAGDAGLLEASRAFLGHSTRLPKVQAGTNVTIVDNALGPVVSASGSSVDDSSALLATRAFDRLERQPKVQAGVNVTIAENALGPVISATAGASVVDDASNILANRAFLAHPLAPLPPEIVTIEQDFGPLPTNWGSWTITDSTIRNDSEINAWCSGIATLIGGVGAPDADETDMEPMSVRAESIVNGSFNLVAEVQDGPVEGPYRFSYYVANKRRMPLGLAVGLESFWKLEEVSGVRYDAVGDNHLISDVNTVTQAVGKLENAAQFVAINSEGLTRPSNPNLQVGDTDFTICAWVYFDSLNVAGGNSGNSIVAKGTRLADANTEWLLWYQSGDERIKLRVNDGAGAHQAEAIWGTKPSITTWYFIVAWHDSVANTINIQLDNGTPVSTSYTFGTVPSETKFTVGAQTHESIPANIVQFFDGRIDAVGFWRRVLTSTDRTSLYNGGVGREYPF